MSSQLSPEAAPAVKLPRDFLRKRRARSQHSTTPGDMPMEWREKWDCWELDLRPFWRRWRAWQLAKFLSYPGWGCFPAKHKLHPRKCFHNSLKIWRDLAGAEGGFGFARMNWGQQRSRSRPSSVVEMALSDAQRLGFIERMSCDGKTSGQKQKRRYPSRQRSPRCEGSNRGHVIRLTVDPARLHEERDQPVHRKRGKYRPPSEQETAMKGVTTTKELDIGDVAFLGREVVTPLVGKMSHKSTKSREDVTRIKTLRDQDLKEKDLERAQAPSSNPPVSRVEAEAQVGEHFVFLEPHRPSPEALARIRRLAEHERRAKLRREDLEKARRIQDCTWHAHTRPGKNGNGHCLCGETLLIDSCAAMGHRVHAHGCVCGEGRAAQRRAS